MFTSGDLWAADLAKAAPEVKPLLVASALAKVMGLPEAACDAAACVRLLLPASRLVGDFTSRKPLFDRLLGQATPADGESWKAMRCLLHGQLGEWDNPANLVSESPHHDAFLKLARQALAAVSQSWRLIPHQIGSQIALDTARQQSLNLLDASASSVEGLVSGIGPERVDCASLTTEECDTVLLQFNDVKVLRGLNIHETSAGQRVGIEGHTYVDDGTFTELPEAFNQLVTRIRKRAGYERECFQSLDGSNRLVNKLSWEAIVEIALGEPQPANWWEAILTAIGTLGTLRPQLRDCVRQVHWLPLTVGGASKPADLLHLPGAEAELDCLPPEVLNGKVPIRRLYEAVRNHDRFEVFVHAVLPQPNELLTVLANLLIPHPAWSTGLTGEWSADQVADWVAALGAATPQALHVVSVVKALQGRTETELLRHFLQRIAGPLVGADYAEVLKHLADRHGAAAERDRAGVERVFTRYLAAIAQRGRDALHECLRQEGVRLLSRAGAWKQASQLAFPTEDLRDQDIICDVNIGVLASLRPDKRALVIQPVGYQQPDDAAFAQAADQTRETLRRYFAPWDEFIPQEMIGTFIATLGNSPPVIAAARHFLRPRSVEESRGAVDACAQDGEQGRFLDQVKYYTIACVEHQSIGAEVLSVLGSRFPAELRGTSCTIFFGDGVEIQPIQWGQRYRHTLHLRRLAVDRLAPDQLFELLRKSTDVVLRKVFGLRDIDLKSLWKRLGKVEQLHIRIAQNRVVDAAQAFLRQVGAHQVDEVKAVLAAWNEADRRRAEAEEAGCPVPQVVHQQLDKAKKELRSLLAEHSQTQQAILATVERKIRQDYGYEPISVPFEIWQNADDAVVELAVLGRDQHSAVELGFVVQADANGFAFAHWGRLVNEFRSADGSDFLERHFDEDLEKMVVQAISDKRAGEQPGTAVTGKFGLGFKSVFLVSEAPEVVSGNVDFVIRGGIYPVRLDPQRRDALVADLQRLAPEHWHRGTIISLPFRRDVGPGAEEVLALFQRLAPLLVVFSRKLKRLRLQHGSQALPDFRWQPQCVAGGIEVGELQGLDAKVPHALVFNAKDRDDRLELLLGLGPDGLTPLPKDVPAFWVTAPMRATPDYGFAVNGPFEPDMGRVQLAFNSTRNQQLADELARMLGERLNKLWQLADRNWGTLRDQLHLATGTQPVAFWESLWRMLGQRFAEKCPRGDNNVVAALARRILWQSENTGLWRFFTECHALPTGLWDEHRTLTRLPDIGFEAAGALDREGVLRIVSQWSAFRQRVQPGRMVSGSGVACGLRRWGALATQPEAIHFATVVEWELTQGQDLRADPETAGRLGQLVTPDFLKALKEGEPSEREEQENKALIELLPKVLFQVADGSWHRPGERVAAGREGVDSDERLRADFAPPEWRLNPAYTGSAVAFFLACLPRLEANVETMADWVLQAADERKRMAALRYLLKGGLREPLAEKLRGREDKNKWLWRLQTDLRSWFEEAIPNDHERQDILAHILRVFEEEFRQWAQSQQQKQQVEPKEERRPWTVQQLWRWWEQQGEPVGDYVLEGRANWPLFHGGDVPGEEQRKAELKRLLLDRASPEGKLLWYRLFGYACLVSAGRTVTELGKFWVNRLKPEDFWQRTAAGDFSETTQQIFEKAVTAKFTNDDAGGEQAYFWRRVFYDIRKVHRMVQNDFPAVLSELVQQGHGGHLPQFLRTGQLPGPEQPRWIGTFGQSADTPLNFIIRELFRLEVITDEAVRPYAFYVCRPVLRALEKIGWIPNADDGFSGEQWREKLAKDPVHGPLLQTCFDIPLLHMGITHRGDKMPTPPIET